MRTNKTGLWLQAGEGQHFTAAGTFHSGTNRYSRPALWMQQRSTSMAVDEHHVTRTTTQGRLQNAAFQAPQHVTKPPYCISAGFSHWLTPVWLL
mmetsp:Transcript_246/g.452  ORF Transcript_246/g.452 Transcript_246/m.452 type:complete len:94 (-) Transcript_246:1352-1633(-)